MRLFCNWAVSALILAGSFSLLCIPSRADEGTMRNIQAAVKHHICESGTKYDRLSCDRECGGSPGCTPPQRCLAPQDNACLNQWNACVRLLQQVNRDIDYYNSTCAREKVDKIENKVERKSKKTDKVDDAYQSEQQGVEREGQGTRDRSQRQDETARRGEQEGSTQRAESGWQCLADYSSCKSFCRQQPGASGFPSGWCEGICSETGTGRMPKPAQYGDKRCFHAPSR
jgi:hypothetical protein